MNDWETIFENQLIPLVNQANNFAALEACIGVVIDHLFRRSSDEQSKAYFRQVFDRYTGRTDDFPDRLRHATEFLRLVKSVRATLANAAATAVEPQRIAEGAVSSDLVAIAKVPAIEAAPPPPAGFECLFDLAICTQLQAVLGKLACPTGASSGKLPFISAPAFAGALETMLRKHVLPSVRGSRSILSNLRDSHVWESGAEQVVLDMLLAGETNNPILLGWDKRWSELCSSKGASAGEGKALWSFFDRHAGQNGYSPPKPADLALLQSLPRTLPAQLDKAWAELTDLYEQEFAPKAHQAKAREGALRDGLNKWGDKPGMQAHAVEWLAIKAAHSFPKIGLPWLVEFSKNKGKSPAERSRNAPYLMAFVSGPGKA